MPTETIRNPILPGFNPDPSILRVGDDYYIATSTFEWYPGVQIHHSRDLVHWRLLTRPLRRASQLNMLGDPDSCGIWAPCLSYDHGLFYLVYTDVKRYGRTTQGGSSGASLRDFHNYLVTSARIEGEWSDPIYLNSSGFDPSLFHNEDGRKYLVNMLWDHRPGQNRFAGIVLQEYSADRQMLIGARHLIFRGTSLGFTEGPHLYRRNGYYYLLTAEGGTGWGHAVTLARSRELTGPYELHPDVHILTSRHRPDAELQRAGHADLVETQTGESYMVHLCGRPLHNRGRCVLGRETAIQRMQWSADAWLRTADGEGIPRIEVPAPALPQHAFPARSEREEFDAPVLPPDFQWLRSPWPEELFSLTERPGHLRLYGMETLGSLFRQALVARRQQSHCFSALTVVDFEPEHFQQMAGLVCYYNSSKAHYLYISHDVDTGKHIRAMSLLPDQVQADAFTQAVPIAAGLPVHLRVEVDCERLRFAFSLDGQDWQWLPEQLDASILSDEAAAPGTPNFTGAFVGMCCQDLSGTRRPADFDFFLYRERGYIPEPLKEKDGTRDARPFRALSGLMFRTAEKTPSTDVFREIRGVFGANQAGSCRFLIQKARNTMVDRRSFFQSAGGALAGLLSLKGLSAAVQSTTSPYRRPRLKITDVRTAFVRALHVRVYSDQGLVGDGEGVDAVSGGAPVIAGFRNALVGQDPLNVDALFERLRTTGIFAGAQGGQYVAALSAVEIALWDLAGKALGLPIYQLLGGKMRNRVRIYCDSGTNGRDDPRAKEFISQIIDLGFTAAKIDIDDGGDAARFDRVNWTANNTEIEHMVDKVAFMRESLPKRIDLAVDMHGRYDAGTGKRMARELEPFKLLWLEEPVPPENVDAMRDVRESSHVPICSGENLYLRHGFRELLEKRAVDIIMPDIQKCGGLLEARKIADMAHTYYVPMAPHCQASPVGTMASCHVLAAIPNCLVLEWHWGHPAERMSQWKQYVKEGEIIDKGYVTVPDRPGIGLEMNDEFVRKLQRPGAAWFA